MSDENSDQEFVNPRPTGVPALDGPGPDEPYFTHETTPAVAQEVARRAGERYRIRTRSRPPANASRSRSRSSRRSTRTDRRMAGPMAHRTDPMAELTAKHRTYEENRSG